MAEARGTDHADAPQGRCGGERQSHRGARFRWSTALAAIALAACALVAEAADEGPGLIEHIEIKTEAAATKVIVMLSRPLPFDVRVLEGEAGKSAQRLVLDFADTTLAPEVIAPRQIDDGFVRQIRTGAPKPGTARLVLDLASDVQHAVEAYETPPHVTIAITGRAGGAPPDAVGSPAESAAEPSAPAPVRTARPTAKPKPKPTPARPAHGTHAAKPQPTQKHGTKRPHH